LIAGFVAGAIVVSLPPPAANAATPQSIRIADDSNSAKSGAERRERRAQRRAYCKAHPDECKRQHEQWCKDHPNSCKPHSGKRGTSGSGDNAPAKGAPGE